MLTAKKRNTSLVDSVIDTNVLISALLTPNKETYPTEIIDAIFEEIITPVFCNQILEEYEEVMEREKFHGKISPLQAKRFLHAFEILGKNITELKPCDMPLPDSDDVIFYQTAISNDEPKTYITTGNKKHFPTVSFALTPKEMSSLIWELIQD